MPPPAEHVLRHGLNNRKTRFTEKKKTARARTVGIVGEPKKKKHDLQKTAMYIRVRHTWGLASRLSSITTLTPSRSLSDKERQNKGKGKSRKRAHGGWLDASEGGGMPTLHTENIKIPAGEALLKYFETYTCVQQCFVLSKKQKLCT